MPRRELHGRCRDRERLVRRQGRVSGRRSDELRAVPMRWRRVSEELFEKRRLPERMALQGGSLRQGREPLRPRWIDLRRRDLRADVVRAVPLRRRSLPLCVREHRRVRARVCVLGGALRDREQRRAGGRRGRVRLSARRGRDVGWARAAAGARVGKTAPPAGLNRRGLRALHPGLRRVRVCRRARWVRLRAQSEARTRVSMRECGRHGAAPRRTSRERRPRTGRGARRVAQRTPLARWLRG